MVVITDDEHDLRLELLSKGEPLPADWPKVTIPESEYKRLNEAEESNGRTNNG